jgi:glutathione S-transferase
MKITDVKTFVVGNPPPGFGGRYFVFIKLITDEGITLFESVVVCEYLDTTFNKGAKLFPAAGMARWKALRWQALGSGMLEVEVAWRSETRRPSPHAVAAAAFEEKAKSSLDLLEREAAELQATPYNISHVSIACALAYLDFRFAEDLNQPVNGS